MFDFQPILERLASEFDVQGDCLYVLCVPPVAEGERVPRECLRVADLPATDEKLRQPIDDIQYRALPSPVRAEEQRRIAEAQLEVDETLVVVRI